MVQVLVLALLLTFLRWAFRIRRRIVIEAFQNFTGDDRNKATVEGLSALMVEELARLADLYRTIDQGWPAPISGKSGGKNVIEVTATVEHIDEQLRGAVSSTSELNLGPLKIPVGAILLPLSRLLKGPRLSGSVHLDGDQPVLIAHLGGRGSFQWRVTRDDLDSETASGSAGLLVRMVNQLSYRVLTDLLPIGSCRWRAVRSYTLGLCYWRRTINTRKERNLHLRRAEAAFIAALSEDNEFARCHYNLGVVYRDLGNDDAATAAFWKAVEADPAQVDAWYALAHERYASGDLDGVLRLCDRAITVAPKDPRAWNLFSVAEAQPYRDALSGAPKNTQAHNLSTQATSVSLSLWALASAMLRGRREPRSRDAAALNMSNLAITCSWLDRPFLARRLFQQALQLAPNSVNIHLEMGRIHLNSKSWERAIRVFEKAVRIGDAPLAWARLAEAHAYALRNSPKGDGEPHRVAVRDACRRALDDGSSLEAGVVEEVLWAYRLLPTEDDQKEVDRLQAWEDVNSRLKRPADESFTAFEQRLKKLVEEFPGWGWLQAQVECRLAQERLYEEPSQTEQGQKDDRQRLKKAEQGLHEAIRLLERDHPREIRSRGLYGQLARACVAQERLQEALGHARRAVSLNPERAWERTILGEVYLRLNDYDLAEQQWRLGLALEPDEEARINLTRTAWDRGVAIRDPARRRELFERVVERLRGVLEQEPRDPGWAHYWLGQFNEALLRFDDAIYHYKVAQQLRFNPLEAQVDLARVYTSARAWDAAERAVRDALAKARWWMGTDSTSQPPKESGEKTPINTILAEAWLVLALCWAEREKKLDVAERLTRLAARRIARIAEPSMKLTFRASLAQYRGWIRYKQGMLDEAIGELVQSVALSATGDAYYRLARAYLARAERESTGKAHWLAKARRACVHARENDLNGEYGHTLTTVEQELDDASRRAQLPPLQADPPGPPPVLRQGRRFLRASRLFRRGRVTASAGRA
ncbi:tetratricopeptide repeat protein [Archangium lansingense]|uniref:tetratricopeptide repeat protein n=1 Tax=Archangium lansingense TaxID=2995310 RepID=UPI003B8151EF